MDLNLCAACQKNEHQVGTIFCMDCLVDCSNEQIADAAEAYNRARATSSASPTNE